MAGEILSFAVHAVDRAAASRPELTAIGGVWIYGLDQLEQADGTGGSFVERWRDAICSCVGGEEFEKLCFTRMHGFRSR